MTDMKPRYENILDIHCHLLPAIDDGPKTWDESLDMARIATQNGIRVAVTTPHWILGTQWQPKPEEVINKVNEFNEKLKANEIPLTVLPGMEIGISENLDKLYKSGRLLTLGQGNFLLVEVPFGSLPYGIEEILFGIRAIGISPILAHPERSQEIQKNPKRIVEFVRSGAFVQVTASSFTGYFGEEAKICGLELIKMGLVHAIASDAHSRRERPASLTKGLMVLEELIGREEVLALIESPYKFLQNSSN